MPEPSDEDIARLVKEKGSWNGTVYIDNVWFK